MSAVARAPCSAWSVRSATARRAATPFTPLRRRCADTPAARSPHRHPLRPLWPLHYHLPLPLLLSCKRCNRYLHYAVAYISHSVVHLTCFCLYVVWCHVLLCGMVQAVSALRGAVSGVSATVAQVHATHSAVEREVSAVFAELHARLERRCAQLMAVSAALRTAKLHRLTLQRAALQALIQPIAALLSPNSDIAAAAASASSSATLSTTAVTTAAIAPPLPSAALISRAQHILKVAPHLCACTFSSLFPSPASALTRALSCGDGRSWTQIC
jgi:hypothetical protein